MLAENLIDAIRLPFRKDKELYRSFRSIMGFYPRDIRRYKEAVTHKSMLARSEEGRPLNNERLEYLGDAVLEAVVSGILVRHFEGKREGFLTTARSRIVQRETLGQVAERIGLDRLVRRADHSQSHNSYLAGNAFEAVMGAIYLDRGYAHCVRFVRDKVLGRLIDIDQISYREDNFKSKLLEWSQRHKVRLEYREEENARPRGGSPVFRAVALVGGVACGEGTGYSKRQSQQAASKNAMCRLRTDKALRGAVLPQA